MVEEAHVFISHFTDLYLFHFIRIITPVSIMRI